MGPASTSRREIGSKRDHCAIVPYCSACLRHASRPRIISLGTIYASFLLAVFGGMILAATWDSRWGTTVGATLLSILPPWWSRWLRLPRQLGHAARGEALALLPEGLACASEPYAHLLGEKVNKVPRLATLKPGPWHRALLIGPLWALVITPCLHHLMFPVVRVVNLADRTVTVIVDDRRIGIVDPTSGESPAAGEVLRLPSGRHRLRALEADGSPISDVQVEIRSGFEHLYAPGASDGCFYLEHISHGRSQFNGPTRAALTSAVNFWVIPRDVDLWFVDEPSTRRGATTGGVVTVLRMGHCR